MGGLLTALNAGKTSLSTNQKSIEIVGNNIANVNTPGYSRQRAELMQIPALNFGDFFVGQGVTVSNVRRDHDIFITRQLHEKSITLGEELGRSSPMIELERIFNIADENLAAEIDRFFDSWQELTTNPSGLVERDIVIQRGQLMGDAFAEVAQEMENVRQNINNSIVAKVDDLNETINEIARLNERIQLVEISGQSANSSRDQRDLLIEGLSKTLGVQTFVDKQDQLNVHLPGGLPLVIGNYPMSIEADTSGADVVLRLNAAGSVRYLSLSDLGGEIKGMMEVRDVFLADIRDNVDKLALDVTEAINGVHTLGYGLDGVTGRNFFQDLGGVQADAARQMRVAFTDPTWVAAAGNPAAAPGDNENALLLAELETTHFVAGTSDNFDNFFSKIVATVGIEAARNNLAVGGAEDAMVQLQNLRDGFAGVSLEEEMIDLIQYQRGFQSSAKFLSTIDEMMGSLLQLKG
ncbi:MAG: flagellar hook-associated protein FlgK [Desulfobulbaceae bacterium]|nr:flagellar hook-associated protein FlgK [Desulfobulbaceae bacterium]